MKDKSNAATIVKQQKELGELDRGMKSLLMMILEKDENYNFLEIDNEIFHCLFEKIRDLIKAYNKEIQPINNELLKKDLLLNKVKHFKTTKTYKVLKFLKLCSL